MTVREALQQQLLVLHLGQLPLHQLELVGCVAYVGASPVTQLQLVHVTVTGAPAPTSLRPGRCTSHAAVRIGHATHTDRAARGVAARRCLAARGVAARRCVAARRDRGGGRYVRHAQLPA